MLTPQYPERHVISLEDEISDLKQRLEQAEREVDRWKQEVASQGHMLQYISRKNQLLAQAGDALADSMLGKTVGQFRKCRDCGAEGLSDVGLKHADGCRVAAWLEEREGK